MRRQERACFPSTIPYLPRNYYRFHTDRDWGVATNYNLTLDSGTLGEDACVEIILRAMEG